jgi:hypothetical protein
MDMLSRLAKRNILTPSMDVRNDQGSRRVIPETVKGGYSRRREG